MRLCFRVELKLHLSAAPLHEHRWQGCGSYWGSVKSLLWSKRFEGSMGEILQTPASQKVVLKWKKQGVRGSQFLPMYMILVEFVSD